MYDCNSEYIVNFYGAFLSDNNDVIMCMEYMDVGYVYPGKSMLASILTFFTDLWTVFPETLALFELTFWERSQKPHLAASPISTSSTILCIEISNHPTSWSTPKVRLNSAILEFQEN
jgi:hypothetical protein